MRQRHPSWQILQLEPTGDVRAIKRAYAQRLKVVRPDEHAELFQQLREAYEWALEQAPRITNASPPVTLAPAPAPPIPPSVDYAARPDRAAPTSPAGSAVPAPLVQPAPPVPPRQPQAPPVPPVQPAPQSDHPEPPRPPAHRPAQAGVMAWQTLLASCQSALAIPFDADHLDQLREAIKTVKARLAASLRTPALEPLEARMQYQQAVFDYGARDDAAPLLRLCCRAVYEWEKNMKSVHPRSQIAMVAMQRAEADAQYFSLLERALLSRALRDMLLPGMPAPRDRDLYRNEYRDDTRQFLGELRTSLAGAARYWFDAKQMVLWSATAARRWPNPGTVVACAVITPVLVFCAAAPLSQSAGVPIERWPATGVWWGLLMSTLLGAALVLAAPYYGSMMPKSLRRLQAMRSALLATWTMGAVLLLFGIVVNAWLPDWQTPYLYAIVLAPVASILIAGGIQTAVFHFIVMALFGFFLSGTVAAFLPGLRHTTVLGYAALAAHTLFWLPGIVRHSLHADPSRPTVRAILLATGLLIWYATGWLAPHAMPLALALGLCWSLTAAAGADLLVSRVTSMKESGVGSALLWVFGLSMTVAPLVPPVDSPLAALQQLQAMLAMSISLGLLGQGYTALRQALGRLFRKR